MAEYYGSKTTLPTTTLTNITLQAPNVEPIDHISTEEQETLLSQKTEAEQEQQTAIIDHATEQGITELQRAEEDAQEQFQTQRDQIDREEAKALDNQALYAEARGDRGGIGQAQYGAVQNTAAQNRLAVSRAQTKLATDTARQIADLRAEGEFKKADALLTLTQQHLSMLMELKTWAAETNLDVDMFNASLRQWEADFRLSQAELGLQQEERLWNRGQEEKDQLADAGWALLDSGILPSALQLQAMELTEDQARAYLQGRAGGGGQRNGTKPLDRDSILFKIRRSMLEQIDPKAPEEPTAGTPSGYHSLSKNTDMLT